MTKPRGYISDIPHLEGNAIPQQLIQNSKFIHYICMDRHFHFCIESVSTHASNQNGRAAGIAFDYRSTVVQILPIMGLARE